MTDRPWRLFRRRARWLRQRAERGRQYDGSRWELKGRYVSEQQAVETRDLLLGREGPFPRWQYKIMHEDEGRL